MRVSIKNVKYLQEELKKINSVLLEDIRWYDGDTLLNINEKIIKEFAFTGLNNTDFIASGYYKKGKK